jgi:hypothetical protein
MAGRHHEEKIRRISKMRKMLPATYRAIIKCLHSDRTPSEEKREIACRLFNDFRSTAK